MIPDKFLAGEIYNKQKIWGYLFVFPAYMFYIPKILTTVILYLIASSTVSMDLEFANLLLNFVAGLFSTILCIAFLKDFVKENISSFINNIKQSLVWVFPLGYFTVYGLSIISNLIVIMMTADPNAEASNQVLIESMASSSPLLLFVQAVIFAPIVEELLFRGLIFRSLTRYSIKIGVLVSAGLFGLLHTYQFILAGDMSQIIQTIPYFAMGLGFSLIYLKSGNIISAILAHALNNLIALILVYVLL